MKFLKKPQDNKKKGIYIIAGIVGIIVFFIWISLPLMQKSSWDASVYSYGMSKKSADLSLLDSGGIDAPGTPLTGALIDNPATSLELEASSLFKMPESDIKYEEESKNEDAAISSSSSDSSVNPPSVSYQAQQNTSVGKLNKLPSLGGSSGGTMTVGTTHDKFFGSQKAEAKLLPLESKSEELKSNKKGNLALAALKVAEKNSVLAQNAPSLEQSKSAGTSAFEKTVKVDESFLNSKEE
ncbi:MAG: hypothetical protein N2446_03545, partial [Elusimicrobiales bacterium]|nr:hypothetical protein [Elusimicrobiales bacterium]